MQNLSIEPAAGANLSAKVYRSLRASLAAGELRPGQKLTGREISERLGVSQTPAREAMLQLVAERALSMNTNRSVSVPELTREQFIELRDMRIALEGLACRYAAGQATDADVSALESLHRDMLAARRGGDPAGALSRNREIHFSVYRIGRRDELLAAIEALWVRTGPCLARASRDTAIAGDEPHAHEALFQALRERDAAGSEAAVARDILQGSLRVLDALPSESGRLPGI